MNRTLILCAVLLLLPLQQAAALVAAEKVSDELFEAEYPWMVAVVHKANGGICGGVLVAPRWVLTAAHCANWQKYVLVGSAERGEGRRVETVRPVRHPEFDVDTLQYDIALLELEEAVDLPVAPLPTETLARVLLVPGAKGTLLGWGRVEARPGPVDRLREGSMRLNSLGLRGSQIVYSYRGGGPCGRDSGGPMLLRTLDGRLYVAGIASATDGELCSKGGGAAVYSNVGKALGFIRQHIGEDADAT